MIKTQTEQNIIIKTNPIIFAIISSHEHPLQNQGTQVH